MTSVLFALYQGLARHERFNEFVGDVDLTLEIVNLGNGKFSYLAITPEARHHGTMTGRALFNWLRREQVPFDTEWEVLHQWQI